MRLRPLSLLGTAFVLLGCGEDGPVRSVEPVREDAGRETSSPVDAAPEQPALADAARDVTPDTSDASPEIGPDPTLAIVRHPHDSTIIEGRSAFFGVETVPGGLGYQWQRAAAGSATFSDLAGRTSPELELPAVPLAEDGSRYRVTVASASGSLTSNAAALAVLPVARAARVYVTPNHEASVFDHVLATYAGPEYSGRADMAAGTFGASIPSASRSASAFAGLFSLRFTNRSSSAVVFAAGALRARIDGTYTHPPLQPASATACQASLQAVADRHYQARALHQLVVRHDGGETQNDFRKVTEAQGATAQALEATPARLVMELSMPEMRVDAGKSLVVVFQLETNAQWGTTDFSSTPARLTLGLPSGARLDHEAAVDLRWVTGQWPPQPAAPTSGCRLRDLARHERDQARHALCCAALSTLQRRTTCRRKCAWWDRWCWDSRAYRCSPRATT